MLNTEYGSETMHSGNIMLVKHIYSIKDISNPVQQTGINCIPLLQDMPNDIAGIYFQVHQMPLARSPKVIIFYPLLAYHSESQFQKRDCLKSYHRCHVFRGSGKTR